MYQDSVEVNEMKYPLLWEENELITGSGGAGCWRGAPATRCAVRPRQNPGTWAYTIDGHLFPPKGIHGGQPGGASDVWKHNVRERKKIDLPKVSCEVITPDEVIVSECCGGGGFGNPLDRDPEKVRWDVREGYVSLEKAQDVYGVMLDTGPEQYAVDYRATEELRKKLRKLRKT